MQDFFFFTFVYFSITNVITAMLFFYDKRMAVQKKRRLPERNLLLWCAIGGATAAYVVMQKVRHKTQKKRFQILLPLWSVLHIAFVGYVTYSTFFL